MATKKQKRLAGELKQARNREEVAANGLRLLEQDRKMRAEQRAAAEAEAKARNARLEKKLADAKARALENEGTAAIVLNRKLEAILEGESERSLR